jgi:acetyl-CoA carboxylase biotin carboxyl carrier protein
MSKDSPVGLDDRLESNFEGRFAGDFPGERSRQLEHALETVTRAVSEVTRCAHLPSVMRVRGGDLSVEIEWHHHAAGAPPAAETAAPQVPLAVAAANGNGNGSGNGNGHAAPAGEDHCVLASTVGVFYRAPEPGAAPFVAVGDEVVAGQQIGIVEVMKLMVPVEADRPGRITAVLQENNTPVEYGTPLFRIAPHEG